ncbi:MAG: crossover junction endodeoxyribonuclease RuvC [bacterium]
MIILGVDPGTLITGYGVIEVKNGKLRMLASDVIKNRSDYSMPLRLKKIYDTLCMVIDRYHPDEFAIETAFYGKNVQSALKLGHARGVSILAAVHRQLPTSEYSPREIKQSVVGSGAASKDQVSYMVQAIFRIKERSKNLDVTDALAVAFCHYLRRVSTPTLSGKPASRSKSSATSWKSFVEKNTHRIIK